MSGALATLRALARADAATSNPDTSTRLFEGALLSLIFEVEARADLAERGLEAVGHGFETRPRGY